MENINKKLNLGPRTTYYLFLNDLPNTDKLKDYSIEQLSGYKLPPKCIREIEEQLEQLGLKLKS